MFAIANKSINQYDSFGYGSYVRLADMLGKQTNNLSFRHPITLMNECMLLGLVSGVSLPNPFSPSCPK